MIYRNLVKDTVQMKKKVLFQTSIRVFSILKTFLSQLLNSVTALNIIFIILPIFKTHFHFTKLSSVSHSDFNYIFPSFICRNI